MSSVSVMARIFSEERGERAPGNIAMFRRSGGNTVPGG
jgi:hypothetical protein